MKHRNITFAQKNIAFEYALKQQGIMKQQGLYGILYPVRLATAMV